MMPKTQIIFICILILFSCKKEEIEKVESKNQDCPTIDPNLFTATCWTSKYYDAYENSTVRITKNYQAKFSFRPKKYLDCNEIMGNNINVNGYTLNLLSTGCESYYYGRITNSYDFDADDWYFEGDSIPNFTFSNKQSLPTHTLLSVIPDTISKTSGFTFTLNIQNIDYGLIMLGDSLYKKSYNLVINQAIENGSNIISLSPSQLQSWAKGNTGFVSIFLNNDIVVNACTRNYLFSNQTQYTKRVFIKP